MTHVLNPATYLGVLGLGLLFRDAI